MPPTLRTAVRLITFRASHDELRSLNHRHLVLGLFLTWAVGIGRWWEDPRASWLQHLGVGSVIYIFVLSLLLWLMIWPVAVQSRPTYRNVLTFVSLTAVPGFLYALPVRTMFDLQTGQTIRLWFLAIVASWRVALLMFYLMRRVRLSSGVTAVTALFPLTLIIALLTMLNLEHVVFNFMGRIKPEQMTVNDNAYDFLFWLSIVSMYSFLPLVIAYAACSVIAMKRRRSLACEPSGAAEGQ